MIQSEDHCKGGDAREPAAEPLEKAQRSKSPRKEAGGPWTELEGHAVQPRLEPDHESKTDVFQGGSCRDSRTQEVEEEVQPLLSAHSESVGVFEGPLVLPWSIQGRQTSIDEWQLGEMAHPAIG